VGLVGAGGGVLILAGNGTVGNPAPEPVGEPPSPEPGPAAGTPGPGRP
jgi:hypothetical protein